MSRLTRYLTLDREALELQCRRICKRRDTCTDDCTIRLMQHKLAEHEDAEERGLSIRLPCRVGDTVYIIGGDGRIKTGKVTMLCIKGRLNRLGISVECDDLWVHVYGDSEIGESVFLARQDAEIALAAYMEQEGITKP